MDESVIEFNREKALHVDNVNRENMLELAEMYTKLGGFAGKIVIFLLDGKGGADIEFKDPKEIPVKIPYGMTLLRRIS